MNKWEMLLCPNIYKILENDKIKANSWIPIWVRDLKFEINYICGDRYVIDVVNQTCKCIRWDLTGISCSYAISTIFVEEK